MRYTIFDPAIPAAKGYSYTPEQIEYIVTEFNTNPLRYVVMDLDSPVSHRIAMDRIVGKLVNARIEEGCITAELSLLDTPMGKIANELQNNNINLSITICGSGTLKDGLVEGYTLSHANMYHVATAKIEDIIT